MYKTVNEYEDNRHVQNNTTLKFGINDTKLGHTQIDAILLSNECSGLA